MGDHTIISISMPLSKATTFKQVKDTIQGANQNPEWYSDQTTSVLVCLRTLLAMSIGILIGISGINGMHGMIAFFSIMYLIGVHGLKTLKMELTTPQVISHAMPAFMVFVFTWII